MNHATAELISAYLDDVLAAPERERLERRLAAEPELRAELESMRQLVLGLRALPRIEPPFELESTLVRHLTLADERPGLGARLERRLGRAAGQPAIAVTFAVVLAIATMIFVLARTVQPGVIGRIPVDLDPPSPAAPALASAVKKTAHGTFHLVDEVWIAADVIGPPDRIVAADRPEVVEMLAGDPELASLLEQRPVRLRVEGEIWQLAQSQDARPE